MLVNAAIAGLFSAGAVGMTLTNAIAATSKGKCVGKNSCNGSFMGKDHRCGGYTIEDVTKAQCKDFMKNDKENNYKFSYVQSAEKKG